MTIRTLFIRGGLLAILLALAAGGYWAWYRKQTQSQADRYRVQAVQRGDLTQLAAANGTLNPTSLVSVGTQVSGTVKRWYADFNDKVNAGQILLELDPALYEATLAQSRAQLASAQSKLRLARANVERSRQLFQKEYITRQELDTSEQAYEAAQAQVKQIEAQVTRDRTNREYSVIRSPVNGVVIARAVDVGQTVAASLQTPTLYQIAQDLSKMQIDASYAEADIGSIREGQDVTFRVDAYPDRTFTGKVRQVRLNATTTSNVVTYNVVISVDNPDLVLLPGMTAYVSITIAERRNVLRVPNAALRFRPVEAQPKGQSRPAAINPGDKPAAAGTERRGSAVFVLMQGKPRRIAVETGLSDGRMTEVAAPELQEGMQVIVEDRLAAKPDGAGGNRSAGPRMF